MPDRPVLTPRLAPLRRLAPALAAAGLLASACSSAGHRAAPPTGPASSVEATTPTTETAPVYAPSPYAWTRAASPALALGGGAGATLSAVLAPQLTGSWTIVGTRLSATGAPSATVWTSADARSWRATPLEAPPALAQALGAAQYHGVTTVVGSVGEAANQQAAAWYSPTPGAAFVPADVPLTTGASTMSHVAVGTLGTFATGTADGRFAMWSSSDGRHWNELPDAEKVITALPGARVDTLLAVGDSVYAAGSVRRGPWTEAALWASSDGLHWRMVTTAAAAFSGPGDRVIYSLAPFETGLVAVGAVNLGSGWVPASWISPDGLSWSQPATDFPGLAATTGPAAVYGVAGGAAARSVAAIATLAGSTALVATGGGPYGQGAWKSTDGMHWTSLAMPAPAASSGGWRAGLAAATTDTEVIVDSDAGRPYVLVDGPAGWSQPSADPAVFGPVRRAARPVALSLTGSTLVLQVDEVTFPQAIGSPTSHTVVLTSADGRTWTPRPAAASVLPATLPAPGTLTVRVPGRWVAVGPVTAAHPAGWISPDGTRWTAVGPLDRSPGGTGPSSPGRAGGGGTLLTPASVSGLCAAAPAAAGPRGSTTTPGSTTTRPTTGTNTGPNAGTTSGTTTGTRTATTTVGPAAPMRRVPAVAAVGSVPVPDAGSSGTATTVGRAAVAWVSTAGAGWHRATVSSAGPAGSTAAMAGCVATPAGLVAFGTTATTGGAPAPGLWRSTDGSAWTLAPVSAFGADTPHPLVSLAADGSSWLAAADPDPAAVATAGRAATAAGTVTPAGGPPVGPAAGVDSDALVGPPPGPAGDGSGLWLSADGGSSWQLVDTQVAPWAGTRPATVDLVDFAGARPVVAGVVDGQLAVWTGTAITVAG